MYLSVGAAHRGAASARQLALLSLGIPPRSEICIWSHHASGRAASAARRALVSSEARHRRAAAVTPFGLTSSNVADPRRRRRVVRADRSMVP